MSSIYSLLGIKRIEHKFIKTGLSFIDEIAGGIPEGKITEIVGGADVGKTKLLFDIIEKNLLEEKIIVYISTNKSSIGYLKKRNLVSDKLVVCISNNEEEILSTIRATSEYADIIMLDATTNIITSNESKNFDMKQYQDLPGLLYRIEGALYNRRTGLIAINHYVKKDNRFVPRWKNKFEKYCPLRLQVNYYKESNVDIRILTNKF